ncbi:Uncharacterised protein [Klebsiella pneumoniae]|nr:Uncharacterised protein [Klebsiella pneumoniae]
MAIRRLRRACRRCNSSPSSLTSVGLAASDSSGGMNSGSTIHCPWASRTRRATGQVRKAAFSSVERRSVSACRRTASSLRSWPASSWTVTCSARQRRGRALSWPSSRLPPLALSSGRASRTSTLSCITSDTSRTGGKISASSVSISVPSAKRTISRVALSRERVSALASNSARNTPHGWASAMRETVSATCASQRACC